ncbi:hypothetical protein D5086_025457 [Populus alba]|uniref:Uncharacterized protein n=1 Tax=Populus alba TaxID=43335 RepID=A0ACC4AZ71_POPAL
MEGGCCTSSTSTPSSTSTATTEKRKHSRQQNQEKPYRGIRMRKWDKEIRQELGHQAVVLVTCLWTPQSTMTYTLLCASKWSLIRRWSPSWDGGKLTKGCLLEVDGWG